MSTGTQHKTPWRWIALQDTAERLGHLAAANQVRTRRAELKRDLRAGRVDFADLLTDPPAWLETAAVYTFALTVPSKGRAKVGKAFSRNAISPHRTFRELTTRQRDALLEAIA